MQQASILIVVQEDAQVLVGRARRPGCGATSRTPQAPEEVLQGQQAWLCRHMSEDTVGQGGIRHRRPPLRIAQLCKRVKGARSWRTAPRCGQGLRLGAPAVHQKGFGVVRGLSLPRQLIGGGGLTSVRRGTARTACLTLPMGCAIRPANGTGACGERGRKASNPAQHPRERLGGQRAVGRCAVLCAMLRGCALGRIAA